MDNFSCHRADALERVLSDTQLLPLPTLIHLSETRYEAIVSVLRGIARLRDPQRREKPSILVDFRLLGPPLDNRAFEGRKQAEMGVLRAFGHAKSVKTPARVGTISILRLV